MAGKITQTKLKLNILALILGFVGFLLIYWLPSLGAVYGTLVSLILGIMTIYSGGNLTQEWMARKNPLVESTTEKESDPTKGE